MEIRVLTYSSEDLVCEAGGPDLKTTHTPSTFDLMLRSSWAEKMSRGLFRYHLGDLETKALPGELGYVAQLNIQRGTERRKPQEILSLRQNFDPKLFNFNRIKQEEVLFDMCRVQPSSTEETHTGPCAGTCRVLINVSPLERGHCLLVPEPARCRPQLLTTPALQVGLESVFLSADPGYRVGFNSLGAFASVNHLHLHGYYLNHPLRVQWAPTALVEPRMGLYRLGFPNGFMFYTDGQDLPVTVANICKLTDILVDRNIAHNVFMTRGCPPSPVPGSRPLPGGVRVFVWPRVSCFGAKEESGFNVALCELAGHLPFKNRKDFESIDEDGVKSIVQKYVFNDQEFDALQKQIVELL
ncbi:GDP-D-glucose phosphorylase 1 [Brachyhypopomus gauderio]|uniref:GDP-D-glucose phosphorylase 1 n=1 Tax=Brachyhypopomus gauderio TaxID=698409 RepID=UPI0040423B12